MVFFCSGVKASKRPFTAVSAGRVISWAFGFETGTRLPTPRAVVHLINSLLSVGVFRGLELLKAVMPRPFKNVEINNFLKINQGNQG